MNLTYLMFILVFALIIGLNVFVKSIILDAAAFFVIVAMIVVTNGDVNAWLSWGSAFLLLLPLLQGMKKAGISF